MKELKPEDLVAHQCMLANSGGLPKYGQHQEQLTINSILIRNYQLTILVVLLWSNLQSTGRG